MQYSGCCGAGSKQGIPAAEGIDGKQLLELVNELVNAMKSGS